MDPSEKHDKADKRSAILEAMLGVVAEYGFHAAPMALVAERAGVGAGTIYRYFANKEDLIGACFIEIEGWMREIVLSDYPEGRTVRERYMHFATGLLRLLAAHPRERSFFQQFRESPYGAKLIREWLLGAGGPEALRELFREGVERQLIKELPLPVLLALAFGPIMDVCRDHATGILEIDETLIVEVAAACWDGLKR